MEILPGRLLSLSHDQISATPRGMCALCFLAFPRCRVLFAVATRCKQRICTGVRRRYCSKQMLLGFVRVMALQWYGGSSCVVLLQRQSFQECFSASRRHVFCHSEFQDVCQVSSQRNKHLKLICGVFWRFSSSPPTAFRSARADLRVATRILTLTVGRAIPHGCCVKSFTSARAASCHLFAQC